MASGTSASASVVRQLSSLFETGSVAGLSDRLLLDRFIAQRYAAGEAAFTALVTRHGPMVLNVRSDRRWLVEALAMHSLPFTG